MVRILITVIVSNIISLTCTHLGHVSVHVASLNIIIHYYML